MRDGTIDAIASDHSPWDQDSKRLPFSSAAYGIVGLETLLPLSLELYHNRHLSLIEVMRRLTIEPGQHLAAAGRPAGAPGRRPISCSSTRICPGASRTDAFPLEIEECAV